MYVVNFMPASIKNDDRWGFRWIRHFP